MSEKYEKQELLVPFELHSSSEETRNRFAFLINTVAQYSSVGRDVLNTAADQGYQLQMMLMSGMSGFVCPENKTIYLNSSCPDGVLIETLAHECRHIQQHAKGIPASHHEFVLRDAVKVSRAKEADAETIGAAVSYEIMKNGGNDEAWKELEKKAPKITQAMLAAADQEASLNSKMMQAAFQGWYQNKAIMDIYENSYIMTECLGNALSDMNNGKAASYFKREMSSEQIVRAICTDAKGICYWADCVDVLNDPMKLRVDEEAIRLAESVNTAREQRGLKRDDSYRDLFVYGREMKDKAHKKEREANLVQAMMNLKRGRG